MGMHQMLGPSFGAGADYEIERSLRFNAADSANLSKSFSSAGNTKTWTWSAWVKFNNNSGTQVILNSANGNNFHSLYLNSNSKLKWDDVIGGSNVQINLIPDLLIRDFAAWYHIVLAVDTTQSTAADRNKMYINGVQVTYESGNNFGQNDISQFNQGSAFTCNIGSGYNASYTNAYLADVQFIDGTQLAASSFAEYDDDNNWVPKKYSGSYGSNGYHLKFDDNSTSAALGTDSSGNNNTWTVNNLVAAAGVALPGARTAVFFDGVDDKITYTSNSNLNPGSTFTLEAWVYRKGSGEIAVLYGTGVGQVGFRVLGNGKLGVERINTAFDLQTGNTVPSDQWVHVAWTKSGNSLKGWINGQHAGTATSTHSYQGTFATARTLNANSHCAIADLNLVVGTALYNSNFTPPTSPISAHANTKLLCFQNASSATTATVYPSGVTLTATSSPVPGPYPSSESYQIDSLLDSPTNYEADSGNNGGNYCCWNPLSTRGPTFTEGNLTVENGGSGSSGWRNVASTLAVSSGKWYAEFETVGAQVGGLFLGVQKVPEDNSQFNPASFSNNFVGMTANSYSLNCFNGSKRTNSSDSSYGSGMSSGDKIMLALDLDNGKIWWGKNGTWFASGDPDSGTNAAFTGLTGTFVFALGISSNEKIHSNWGQRPFAYSNNISGFKSVCTMNFAEPTIADGSTAFDAKTYTGNGGTQSISLGFSPDFLWFKARGDTGQHALYDVLRGASKSLVSNGTNAEGTEGGGLSTFDSSGFSLSGDNTVQGSCNGTSRSYVAWAWDAGSSTVSNTTGNINSSVRANQSAGFSIVSYTGNGSIGQTIGHGLNAVPQLIIAKSRSSTIRWGVYHDEVGPGNTLVLNSTTTPTGGTGVWGNTVPTNTVFTVSNDGEANANGGNYIAYCFTPVEGFSAFGSYQGNGLTDGSFVYTGFRPALIITKRTDSAGGWVLWDTARNIFNVALLELYPDDTSAEYSGGGMDILSNGFKLRNTSAHENNSGGTYIYAAFAEHPLKTSRAR